jgi:hypothetical protein
MKAVYKQLIDKSLAAALSAIEIYNKPDFKYRDEIFVILIINSWELILKSKILKDNRNKLNSLYVYEQNGRIKRNRTGNPFTIEIVGAIRKNNLEQIIVENLEKLIELRDTSVHFYNADSISYIIYSLGAAALKNYSKIVNEWFAIDLVKEYNFNILPLGFAYNFQTFNNISFEQQHESIKKIITSIQNYQSRNQTESNGYYLICEIQTKLTSAKKISTADTVTVKIDNSDPNAQVTVIKKQKTTDIYPYSWSEIRDYLRSNLKDFNQNKLNSIIKSEKIKENIKYSAYNFKSKRDEDEFKQTGVVKSGTPSLYNDECRQYILSKLK